MFKAKGNSLVSGSSRFSQVDEELLLAQSSQQHDSRSTA